MARVALVIVALSVAVSAGAQPVTDRNVVYGTVWGASLLLDVHRPVTPNGFGIVLISGSGFGVFGPYQRGYESSDLKVDFAKGYVADLGHALVDRGYTVFMVNHRFAPGARFPEILSDVQRAVRWIRAHATDYGIDPGRIGAAGHSSGGTLSAMLGTVDATIENPRKSPVEAQSSKVQAVLALAGQFDMTEIDTTQALQERAMRNVMGDLPARDLAGRPQMAGVFAAASPIAQVTKDDAPMLMFDAVDDGIIPSANSTRMHATLQQAGVRSELVMRQSGGHSPAFDIALIDRFFREGLKR